MKRLFLLALFSISFLSMYSQETEVYVPILQKGKTWIKSSIDDLFDPDFKRIPISSFTLDNDTVFKNVSCTRIKRQTYSPSVQNEQNEIRYWYVFEKNKILYGYIDWIDEWAPLLDFNCTVGDTISWNNPLCGGFFQP